MRISPCLTGPVGRSSSWKVRCCAFQDFAAPLRLRPGRDRRTRSGISVSVTDTSAIKPADPRLDGRAVKRIVYDAEAIHRRVAELGAEITEAYPDGDLLVLGLLKGSFIFLSDLVRHITRPLQVDFLVASSYGDAMESSGVVRLLYDPETELEGKHILLVEDIVD